MKTITMQEANINFDALIDNAQCEPVVIIKENDAVGFFVSMIDVEDAVLGKMAVQADQEGYVSIDESNHILNQFRSK